MNGFRLGPGAQAAGYRVRYFDELDSTSRRAMDLARQGAAENLWVLASRQTAGRGRRGRTWISPPGNLAASLFLKLPRGQQAPHMLGFVAGVALAQTVIEMTKASEEGRQRGGDLGIALKWPNDLMMGRAKLAGILLENQALPDGSAAVVVGMGMNVASAPRGLAYPVAALSQRLPGVSARMVFEQLGESWLEVFSLWNHGTGNAAVLSRWRALALGMGEPIEVAMQDRTVSGIFRNIDEHGRLVVETPSGKMDIITTGDVQF